jgi:hypothetical protein
MASVS